MYETPNRRQRSAPLATEQSQQQQTRRATPAELDDLFERTITLPPDQLFGHFERFVGRDELKNAGLRISECRLSPRPNAERDEHWTRLHVEQRLSYGDIGRMFNKRRATVARAVQRFRQRDDSESLLPTPKKYAS